ncbi:YggS family pyridoxal phosphate-dependent enzyme [Flavobacteriales bacterium]|nr:YggS family pyridoxal phosphate-dependent enzyme [Flavobacteriales bacterium]|tara:strand:- start:799 stop:1458 length:660 start_codon:yes stop_codon:yes gene_type:complete
MSVNLSENLNKVLSSIPEEVKLVAVSKTKPIENIEVLYETGQRIFGENRVEELVEKHESLPKDIEWHMIGHLQSKKTKKIAPFISLIHSIDSFKLLVEIDKEAKKNERIISCLLQFHIAKEKAKYGFSETEGLEIIESEEFKKLENVSIAGVMGMATFTKDEDVVRKEFKTLKRISEKLLVISPDSKTVSMGMSGDYSIAIEEGSSMVRVGSTIFGSRN